MSELKCEICDSGSSYCTQCGTCFVCVEDKIESLKAEKDKSQRLYQAVNAMMAQIGIEGEITTLDKTVSNVMDALYAIDGGEYIANEIRKEHDE